MSEQLMDAPAHHEMTDSGDEVVDQIRRLCELRDMGLLTAEQFLTRRAQILGRPQR